jgi:hypothetical protein
VPRVRNMSVDINCVPFVHQVLEETPCHYVSEPFAHDPGCQPPKVANETVVLVDFYECRENTFIMLCLIFVVILEKCSRSYDVQWMGYHATQ